MECEDRWQVQIPPGYQEGLRFMAHLWEPLRVIYKPLALHLGSEIAHLACGGVLRLQGFTPFPSQVCIPLASPCTPWPVLLTLNGPGVMVSKIMPALLCWQSCQHHVARSLWLPWSFCSQRVCSSSGRCCLVPSLTHACMWHIPCIVICTSW